MSIKRIVIGLSLLLTAVLLVSANAPAAAQSDSWTAKYYNNRDLSGSPVLTRTESAIDHDWGDNAPADVVNRDNFSAKWTRNLYFAPGTYRFAATTDDGMRVYVDNNLVIDAWYDSQVHTITGDVFLSGGNHDVRVEYYEAGGKAVAKLSWSLVGNFAGNWRGEYYNNTSLVGNPALVRFDAQIDFNWAGAPATGINADQFSVRWTSDLQLDPGTYRFATTTDDGVRLWVNGRQVINQWQPQSATTYTADVTVSGGSVPVQMEYYEGGGTAVAVLTWTKIATAPAPAPAPQTPNITNWRGEYYNNIDLAGSPVVVRNDSAIDFIWGSSSPIPNVVNADRFSVRWTQTFNFSPGRYIFTAYADDGVRVWVNGRQVINAWGIHDVQPFAGAITLPGGPAEVRMEYFEFTGLAEVRLTWTREGSGSTPPTQTQPPAGATAPDQATMTGARYLNVRSGPGLDNEAVGYLSSGQAVTLLGRDAFTVWIKVQEADGTVGWVSGRYLTANQPLSNLPVLYNE